ncbi:mesoderm posterior protein 1-like [Thamnophis elegans]|uniref:mesoderm posterior protein 1-like n=1 Tax=Thamnophis elegans TaxID=35005 RepID=UPI0013769A46|nr:mesoderm posterior protein 1-like [Thamnophis elegans]
MARSTRAGCPSPDLGPAFHRPSCCLCPAEDGPGSSSASPASSPDSCGSLPASRAWRAGGRARLGGGQRQSASQREKLRMRRLAQALHALRRYLPASVAPAGQSLTKIETLRLAIRYIGHLSQLLGQESRPPAPPEPEWWRSAPASSCEQGGRADPALLPAELPAAPPSPACQSLPDELLSFLEDFFPLAAPGRD